jgi:hypothetical protein
MESRIYPGGIRIKDVSNPARDLNLCVICILPMNREGVTTQGLYNY